MDETPVHIIRESARNLLILQRRSHRYQTLDELRTLPELRVTPENVADIADKLKKSVTVSELNTLKNSLLDDACNVEVFLNTHGSLRGLVREISGHDISKQCAAAGCCCNLAIGNERACATVARAAGPYLITALDNLSTELAVTCAWALGNLAASGQKVCEVLTSQGAVTKLADLLSIEDEDRREAALYAQTHFAHNLRDDLRPEYLPKILQALSKLDWSMTASHLLFILSCHNSFVYPDVVNNTLLEKLLQDTSASIDEHLINCTQKKLCCKVLYLIRSLSNFQLDDNVYSLFMNFFFRDGLSDKFKRVLLLDNDVKESLLWFLGNLFNYNSNHLVFNDLCG